MNETATPAFRAGAEAGITGQPHTTNPHQPGTQERVEWFDGWMSAANYGLNLSVEADYDAAVSAAWQPATQVYTGVACTACGRNRVQLCRNQKHKCDKCNFCPETEAYAPSLVA